MWEHCRIKRDKCKSCFLSDKKIACCDQQMGENRINQMIQQGIPCPIKEKNLDKSSRNG